MIKVNWDIDEAVVLVDYYLHNGKTSKKRISAFKKNVFKEGANVRDKT